MLRIEAEVSEEPDRDFVSQSGGVELRPNQVEELVVQAEQAHLFEVHCIASSGWAIELSLDHRTVVVDDVLSREAELACVVAHLQSLTSYLAILELIEQFLSQHVQAWDLRLATGVTDQTSGSTQNVFAVICQSVATRSPSGRGVVQHFWRDKIVIGTTTSEGPVSR